MADIIVLAFTAIKSCITGINDAIVQYKCSNVYILKFYQDISTLQNISDKFIGCEVDQNINKNLQGLLVLIKEIEIWITEFCKKHFFSKLFLSSFHKYQMNNFYFRIDEIKCNLGFDIKIENFKSHKKLNDQINNLLENFKKNPSDYEKIKDLLKYQEQLFELKLENYNNSIEDIDKKHKELDDKNKENNDEFIKLKEEIQMIKNNTQSFELEKLKIELELEKVKLEKFKIELNMKNQINQKCLINQSTQTKSTKTQIQSIQTNTITDNNFKNDDASQQHIENIDKTSSCKGKVITRPLDNPKVITINNGKIFDYMNVIRIYNELNNLKLLLETTNNVDINKIHSILISYCKDTFNNFILTPIISKNKIYLEQMEKDLSTANNIRWYIDTYLNKILKSLEKYLQDEYFEDGDYNKYLQYHIHSLKEDDPTLKDTLLKLYKDKNIKHILGYHFDDKTHIDKINNPENSSWAKNWFLQSIESYRYNMDIDYHMDHILYLKNIGIKLYTLRHHYTNEFKDDYSAIEAKNILLSFIDVLKMRRILNKILINNNCDFTIDQMKNYLENGPIGNIHIYTSSILQGIRKYIYSKEHPYFILNDIEYLRKLYMELENKSINNENDCKDLIKYILISPETKIMLDGNFNGGYGTNHYYNYDKEKDEVIFDYHANPSELMKTIMYFILSKYLYYNEEDMRYLNEFCNEIEKYEDKKCLECVNILNSFMEDQRKRFALQLATHNNYFLTYHEFNKNKNRICYNNFIPSIINSIKVYIENKEINDSKNHTMKLQH
jgi:hypothetical protein